MNAQNILRDALRIDKNRNLFKVARRNFVAPAILQMEPDRIGAEVQDPRVLVGLE